jgi:hypothetical protein
MSFEKMYEQMRWVYRLLSKSAEWSWNRVSAEWIGRMMNSFREEWREAWTKVPEENEKRYLERVSEVLRPDHRTKMRDLERSGRWRIEMRTNSSTFYATPAFSWKRSWSTALARRISRPLPAILGPPFRRRQPFPDLQREVPPLCR